MRLENVLALTDATLVNDPFVKIFENIVFEAKRVKRGDLFISFNPREIDEAIQNGAYGVIFDIPMQITDAEIAWIKVEDCEKALKKLLRFRLIEKEVIAYECNEIILKLARQIDTDTGFIALDGDIQSIKKQLWDIEKNTIILFSPSVYDKELFTNVRTLPSVKNPTISIIEKTLFETSFIYNDIFYERQLISPFFIPYLEELFELYKLLKINFTIKKLLPLEHFEAVFINKNAQIKEFGTSDKVVIFEPNTDLVMPQINFLHNNANWANILYLLPQETPEIASKDIFVYSSSDKIVDILKNSNFNFALVVGVDKSILSQPHKTQTQLALDFN